VADRTAWGKPLRWLTLVDEHTKECLALHVAVSATGPDARRALARVIGRRGAPRGTRSDNGSELVCEALTGWLPGKGAEPIPVAPGSPWENGVGESLNSRFRDELLGREELEDDRDAREKGGWFKREHNSVRPHSSLAYQTPKQFSGECEAGLHRQPARGPERGRGPAAVARSRAHKDRSRPSIAGLDLGGRD
jgi:transposase InsO family protein